MVEKQAQTALLKMLWAFFELLDFQEFYIRSSLTEMMFHIICIMSSLSQWPCGISMQIYSWRIPCHAGVFVYAWICALTEQLFVHCICTLGGALATPQIVTDSFCPAIFNSVPSFELITELFSPAKLRLEDRYPP